MNDINILILGSNHSITVAKRLIDEERIASCVCTISGEYLNAFNSLSDNYKNVIKPIIIEEVELYANYENICDVNNIPALSFDLLNDMLPYESMCIKLAMRRIDSPVVDYEEEKRNYHNALRYWNYIIKSNDINAFSYFCTPHYQSHYIIYALCQLKKIPLIISFSTSIPGIMVHTNTAIEDMGREIESYYKNEAANKPISECLLTGTVKAYYEKYSADLADLRNERDREKFNETELKLAKNTFFSYLVGNRSVFQPIFEHVRIYRGLRKGRITKEWRELHRRYYRWFDKNIKYFKLYKKYNMCSQKNYNKMASRNPDLSVPYIYFALQQTPEATSIPQAGVFSEQYTSIQLIARAALKCGVLVYVKEHIVQPFRDIEIYEMLSGIPNVVLVSTVVSTFDLIRDCLAVATQSGTCILEAAIKHKPALVTGRGYAWKGLPSIYEIRDEDQGENVIRKLMNEPGFTSDDVKRYFYAISEVAIRFPVNNEKKGSKGYDEWIDVQVETIAKDLEKFRIDDGRKQSHG